MHDVIINTTYYVINIQGNDVEETDTQGICVCVSKVELQ